jgi:hypothetical protein
MTSLRERKTRLSFETDATLRNREIIVEPTPWMCIVRLKGKRTRYEISWSTIFVKAAEIAADKLRQERKEARRRKKEGR